MSVRTLFWTKGVLYIAAAFLMCSPVLAQQTKQTLFMNPSVRENAAPPKLQGLRWVTVENFAPFSSFDAAGTLRGVHVDLARAICAQLNITTGCTLQAVAFEDVENLLISGQADAALAGIVPSVIKRKNLDFSAPYFRYPSKFLTQKTKSGQQTEVIGVLEGSIHQTMATLLFPGRKQMAFANEANALSALKTNVFGSLFGDGLRLATLLDEDQGLQCCALQPANYFLPELRADALRMAVSLDRQDILSAVNGVLRDMSVDGRLDEIYLRHLPINPFK
jgi:polar amino acid transport system substrate-binding protein